jgi:hypothetical protein
MMSEGLPVGCALCGRRVEYPGGSATGFAHIHGPPVDWLATVRGEPAPDVRVLDEL